MKVVIFIIVFLSHVDVLAQNVEFISGVNYNSFLELTNQPRYESNYEAEIGFAFKVAFENENENKFKWRASIGFEKYGGRINVTDQGFSVSRTVEAEIDKSAFTIIFYPLNETVWDNLDINLGLEFSKIFRDDYVGTSTRTSNFPSSTTTVLDLKDEHPSYNAKSNFGIRGRIAYNIQISDMLILTPQISCLLGLTKEFKEFPRKTRSLRPFFGIGLKKAL